MSERPTPETDAFAIKLKTTCGEKHWVPVDLSRCLERERDEAREHLREIKEYGTEEINAAVELRQKLAQTLIERDEAMEQVKELIYIAERAIDLAEIDYENDKFGVVSELRGDLEKIKEEAK